MGATPSPVLDHGETAVRLDCSVSLPPTVIDEAERTATLLARIAPPRPGWAAYHGAFTDRYGPGALVPIRDLIDPHRGLGYPAGYRGSAFTDRRPVTSRDLTLATHAQEAAMAGRMELVLDEDLLAELETASRSVFPHTELRISIAASDVSAVDRGDFTMTVGCASRHAGTSVGRFLHLLSEADRERITRVYQTLPTATQGGSLMQVASPTLWTRVDGLTRVPPILPILPVGEHLPPHNDSVDLDDLAVTADTQRLTLMSLTTRRPVEPLMLNAVDLKHGVHPLARFLVEISTATSAPCTPFHWGPVAETFAFLPRVRHGRSVLAPARWILSARTLSGPSTPISEWAEAFDIYRRARRVPDLVRLGAEDVLVALDLTDQSHLQLLRRDLAATGTVVVTEDLADDRWIGGRPHEFVVPLASTAPPQPLTRPFRPDRLHRGPGHLPGISPWLHVNLHVRPALQGELLGRLRDLLAGGWDHGPGDWWFIRFPDPAPHLRVRIRLHHADRYGDAARVIGQWAQAAHSKGLLGGIAFDTYRPETGRFGVGRALDAAETVFATDTAVALARLDSPMSAPAATAVGVLDLADGFLGDGGPAWLVSHLAYGGGTRLDRQAIAEVRNPVSLPRELLQRHHKALATYRTLVAPSDIDATMTDLIHLHHARMIGIDSESERTCLRLVRAAVQNVLARRSAS
ncbi:lantibiotic dehydratase [Streptosporangium saharense]|uniref:lantibiotic dehydratase n=1 Tax=Streptosporangium saharense TaxID=1706840 RepID=UPI0034433C96